MIDLTPRPGSASRSRRILTHAAMETSVVLRNGEQLLLALVIPVAALVAGRFLPVDPATWTPSVLALAVWSTGFTSLAINTAFELRYGVLERLAATPLRKADLIAGKALAVAGIAAGQLFLLVVLALILGWRPGGASFGWGWGVQGPATVLVATVAVLLALLTFASWALALASVLKAELVLGAANLLYLAFAALGGLVLSNPALWWLPTAALGDTLRGAAGGWTPLSPLLVLAVWALASAALARKVFRWMS